jgi:hypothetical protein
LVSVKDFVYFPGDKNERFKISSALVCNDKYWASFTVSFFRPSKCDIYFGIIYLQKSACILYSAQAVRKKVSTEDSEG